MMMMSAEENKGGEGIGVQMALAPACRIGTAHVQPHPEAEENPTAVEITLPCPCGSLLSLLPAAVEFSTPRHAFSSTNYTPNLLVIANQRRISPDSLSHCLP